MFSVDESHNLKDFAISKSWISHFEYIFHGERNAHIKFLAQSKKYSIESHE